jgi:hypothetical protein
MQNLPNEIIAEISNHLKPKDLVCFSLTCKEYKDLLSKEVEKYKNMDEVVKKTHYHIISVVMKPEVKYNYYVYDIKDSMDLYERRYPNHELLNEYIRSIEPVIVILKPAVYDSDLDIYIETGESRKMSFDSLLYYVCKRCIAFYKFCNEQLGDEYDMNKVMKRVIKLLDTYKKYGATETLRLLRKYTERLDLGLIIKMRRVIGNFSY